jgi:fructose-1,6-bisphosphatase
MTSVACEVCGKVFDGKGLKPKKCMAHVASHMRFKHPAHWAATESVRKERLKEHDKHSIENLRKAAAAKKKKREDAKKKRREDANLKRRDQKRAIAAAAAATAAAEADNAAEMEAFVDNLWADV